MIDEQLIAEVQQHGVIYNRQKYFLNGGGPIKYESKEAAWQIIAHKLGTDVETCKKRWKYLRERYVQQRKHCDPPTYEHLSRPYLEKMKFLDQHIQPRKSYRNVPHFLSSPNANSSFAEFMDSSRSNGSATNPLYPNLIENFNNAVKSEPEDSFKEYSSISKEQIQLTLQQQISYQQQQSTQNQSQNQQFTSPNQSGGQQQQPHDFNQSNTLSGSQYRENEISPHLPSSSSSLKSPLSSPPTTENMEASNENSKKPRVQTTTAPDPEENEENSDSDSDDYQKNTLRDILGQMNNRNNAATAFQNDFLLSLYQQFPQTRQVRSSEQLLGELVTSELLKMNKEKRRIVQKKILEILFFED
ncbi:histone-lysine N-methyltransferase, H3 lysine-79 specific [Condylostylus longicornis]|uniref:histone-lysine N-methyltransferase, H3 lysine-79 specific n=1 Tax=Condylostylus longicornis TaxID=2530218 RepID=UPI00244DE165|nr:histone-lysine N-methyltransferase, H3 lysine-79 specific [Condylostylus longicornis]